MMTDPEFTFDRYIVERGLALPRLSQTFISRPYQPDTSYQASIERIKPITLSSRGSRPYLHPYQESYYGGLLLKKTSPSYHPLFWHKLLYRFYQHPEYNGYKACQTIIDRLYESTHPLQTWLQIQSLTQDTACHIYAKTRQVIQDYQNNHTLTSQAIYQHSQTMLLPQVAQKKLIHKMMLILKRSAHELVSPSSIRFSDMFAFSSMILWMIDPITHPVPDVILREIALELLHSIPLLQDNSDHIVAQCVELAHEASILAELETGPNYTTLYQTPYELQYIWINMDDIGLTEKINPDICCHYIKTFITQLNEHRCIDLKCPFVSAIWHPDSQQKHYVLIDGYNRVLAFHLLYSYLKHQRLEQTIPLSVYIKHTLGTKYHGLYQDILSHSAFKRILHEHPLKRLSPDVLRSKKLPCILLRESDMFNLWVPSLHQSSRLWTIPSYFQEILNEDPRLFFASKQQYHGRLTLQSPISVRKY